MSLDVYLQERHTVLTMSLDELAEDRWLNVGDVCARFDPLAREIVFSIVEDVYDDNITHNMAKMADEAGIYKHLWRPDEIGITHARQLVEPLAAGLALLESDPDRFSKFNPENGWGDYDGLVDFVTNYLSACREYPDATVYASR